MPRARPESDVDGATTVVGVATERAHLVVGEGLDRGCRGGDEDGDDVEDVEPVSRCPESGPEREQADEHDKRRHELYADEADQPPRQPPMRAVAEVDVAPVL